MDFLSQINITNSRRNEQTGEYILTVPIIELKDEYFLNSTENISITSNCNTIIKCLKITITTIKRLHISNINFESQITIRNSSEVTFSKCTITNINYDKAAFLITNTQSASLSNVKIINKNRIPSIMIDNHSKVTASELFVSDSIESLIVCNSESTFYIKDSTIANTKANGIYASGGCKLKIENCHISSTDYPAIFIRNSTAKILNNSIQNVKQNGISFESSKDVEVIGNKLTDIIGSSISFQENSSGLIHQNKISNINGNGIFVKYDCDVTITENEISQVSYPGIAICMNSKALISSNIITNMEIYAISVRNAFDVTIENCEINEIDQNGISISDTKNCYVIKNKIKNCKGTAVEAYNGSNVKINDNQILNMKEHAFLVFTSAFIKAENNKIDQIGKSLVKMIFKGGGEIINNDVKNCLTQKEGQTSSQYFLSKNGNFLGVTNIESRKSDDVEFNDEKICDENIMCLKCNRRKRNAILADCDHVVFCMECSMKALYDHEECPLCKFPIEKEPKSMPLMSENICRFCGVKGQYCIINPCRHIQTGICPKCLSMWYRNTKRCPVCSKEPSTFKVLYV